MLKPVVDDLVGVDLDGAAALVTPAGAEGLAAGTRLRDHVRLLPAFDTYVLAPRSHRRHAWPDGLHARISRPAGWITPVLLVDGRAEGVWSHERKGSRLTVTIEPFAAASDDVRTGAEQQARRLAEFFGTEEPEIRWER